MNHHLFNGGNGDELMVEKISRSEQKRLYKQVEELAGELAELSDNDLKQFPGNDELSAEIVNCRGLQGAREKGRLNIWPR